MTTNDSSLFQMAVQASKAGACEVLARRVEELEAALKVERDWVVTVNKDNGVLIARCDAMARRIEQLEADNLAMQQQIQRHCGRIAELAEQREGLVRALQEVLAHGVTHEVGCSHREETCSCCRGRAVKALKKAGVV